MLKGSALRVNNRVVLYAGILVAVLALIFIKRWVYFDVPADRIEEAQGQCSAVGWHENTNKKREVWDVFPFNIELDILEVRLSELVDVVDHFVIVEAPIAFSGKEKPLYYELNQARFARFKDKIRHIVVPKEELTFPSLTSAEQAVQRKVTQKNWVMRGLEDANPEDLVIVSDLDEIPKATVVKMLKECEGYVTPVEIHFDAFIYDFGCQESHSWFRQWRRGKIVRRYQLDFHCDGVLDYALCFDELRDDQHLTPLALPWNPTSIGHGGWHISYFMTMEEIFKKLESNSHIERNSQKTKNEHHITCLMYKCKHVNGRDGGTRKAPVHGPQWVYDQVHVHKNPTYLNYYSRDLPEC